MSNEQPHDPTITLRLELGRITDQRDAFKAALNAEVLKVVRVAIIQATIDADNEIARLKAEFDEYRKAATIAADSVIDERYSLKAEVERLRASSFVTAVPVEQYERVIKAGDSLVYSLQWCDWGSHIQTMDAVNRWNAAKEGKQP